MKLSQTSPVKLSVTILAAMPQLLLLLMSPLVQFTCQSRAAHWQQQFRENEMRRNQFGCASIENLKIAALQNAHSLHYAKPGPQTMMFTNFVNSCGSTAGVTQMNTYVGEMRLRLKGRQKDRKGHSFQVDRTLAHSGVWNRTVAFVAGQWVVGAFK